jgi:CRP/FNR family cyclic AMP-dependent transcriptional regulator
MASIAIEDGLIVWGLDNTPYGPVELPTVVSWIKDERVTAETWLFIGKTKTWQKASEVAELQMFFSRKDRGPLSAQPKKAVDPRVLRRVKILGGLAEDQLQRFADFMEIEKVSQWSTIVKQGEIGESMYCILEGELRVRLDVGGRETILATLGPGEFFGDISLFDQGPRSADVVANKDSLLLKISAKAFGELAKEAPEIATPFLLAVGKTLTARIRADNKRFGDSVKFARAAE